MQFISDMDGYQPTFHSHVHVVNHCAKGGYAHMRHDEIRDTFASLMSEVCYDVEIEPKLQSLQGESFVNNSTTTDEDARLDVKTNGLWAQGLAEPSLMSVFHPHAKTSRRLLKDAYNYHESPKNSNYQQRVLQADQSSFCPLIFGCTGGDAAAATRTMQRIAEKLNEKRHQSYSETINYVRTKISFALLRSAILRIRGCRFLCKTQFINNSINAITEEGRLK